MEQTESTKNMKLVSSTKISSSRILKYTLIVITIVTVLYLVSLGAIYLLSVKALAEGITDTQISLVEKVSEFIKISPETTIVALATTTVLRYLTRETAQNITGKGYGMTETSSETKE